MKMLIDEALRSDTWFLNTFLLYKLIDPRDRRTFFVGVGKGSRIIEHADGLMNLMEDNDLIFYEMVTIRDILKSNMSVEFDYDELENYVFS
jgi:hypothetical protein